MSWKESWERLRLLERGRNYRLMLNARNSSKGKDLDRISSYTSAQAAGLPGQDVGFENEEVRRKDRPHTHTRSSPLRRACKICIR